MEPRELVGLIAFFSETLDQKQLDALAAAARRRSIPEGGVLIKEDDPGTSMFVVESGDLDVTVAGEKEPVARVHAGDVVGEASLFTGRPRNATVTAVEPVEVIEIDK